MRTVTAKQLAYALDIDESTIRKREGTTMPKPIDEKAKPHMYELRKVLYVVNGKERDLICSRLQIRVSIVISESDDPNQQQSGYVPA